MRALIIEDEVLAQKEIERLLALYFPQIEVVERITSVVKATQWIIDHPQSFDFIFSDVELADGTCFEIYSRVKVGVPIIFTTAYNEYAIKAFKVDGIDYLLKPIDAQEFVLAVSKCIKQISLGRETAESVPSGTATAKYRNRVSVRLGDKIIIVSAGDIAYLYSEDKSSYLVTREGKRYVIDASLDAMEPQLDPKEFFRMSRNSLVAIQSIKSISKHFNGRLKVTLNPNLLDHVLVSRVRSIEFVKWIDGDLKLHY